MTIVAWDGKTLAADKRMISSGLMRTCRKIWEYNGNLIAITGDWDAGAELIAWFNAGADPAKFPEAGRKDTATLIVINTGCVWQYNAGPYGVLLECKQCAFGSGRDYAEAALYLGKTAYEAVEVACHFESSCGGGIDVLALKVEEA